MKKINERIEKVISLSGLSNSEFADRIEVPRSSISHLLSGRNKPSLDFLMKIKAEFPKYHWDWLIYGSGEMEEQNKAEQQVEKKVVPTTASLPDLFSLIGDEEYGVTESEDKVQKAKPSDFPIPAQAVTLTATGESQPLENRELEKKKLELETANAVENKIKRIVFFYENGKFETFEP